MGLSRQEYWSGLPFPSPGDLPNPGIEPRFPALQTDALPSEPPGKPKVVLSLEITMSHKPDHLIGLLRNLYAGQETTVRTGHGTTDWFQIGKGVVKAVYCHPVYLTYMQSTS